MSVANFLNHSGTLQSLDTESDLSAGIQRTWTDELTGQAIRVEDASAKEIETQAANGAAISHRIFCLTDAPQIGQRWVYDSRYFVVKSILRRRGIGGVESFWVNMCLEVAPNG